MSELDDYRKLENKIKNEQREISSALRRMRKLEEKIQRKRKSLRELLAEKAALDGGS